MRIRTERAQQWFFLAALFLGFLHVCAFMLESSGVFRIDYMERVPLLNIMLGLAACAIFLRGWNFIDLLLLAFAYRTTFAGDYNEFAFLILFFIVARGLDERWLVRAWLGMYLVLLVFCTVCYPFYYLTGSSHATVTMGGDVVRYNFFFNHCNGYGLLVACCALAFVYIYYEKIRYLWINLTLLGAVLLCWFGPKCKTAAMILILCACLLAMWRYVPKLFQVAMWIGLPLLVVVICGIVFGYYWGIIPPDYEILSANTFTARFVDAAIALILYPLNLLGQMIPTIGMVVEVGAFNRLTWLDLGHVRLLIRFGLVGGAVFYTVVFVGMARLLKRREWLKAIMIFLMMTYFTMEWIPFTYMFPLIFAGNAFCVRWKPFLRYSRYGLRAQNCGPERAVEP